MKLLYEGKAKKIYESDEKDLLIAEFKDDLTAFNAQKKGMEEGKGILNHKITAKLFRFLEDNGIQTHYVKSLNERQMLVKNLKIIPIEVVLRNVLTGSIVKRLGLEDGRVLDKPLVEFYYKEDSLDDPIIMDEHAMIMGLVKEEKELEYLKAMALQINSLLLPFFYERGLRLIDFKIEFGRTSSNEIILADEISPDSCRFWDKDTNEKLDKDLFRKGLSGLKVAYEDILERVLKSK